MPSPEPARSCNCPVPRFINLRGLRHRKRLQEDAVHGNLVPRALFPGFGGGARQLCLRKLLWVLTHNNILHFAQTGHKRKTVACVRGHSFLFTKNVSFWRESKSTRPHLNVLEKSSSIVQCNIPEKPSFIMIGYNNFIGKY